MLEKYYHGALCANAGRARSAGAARPQPGPVRRIVSTDLGSVKDFRAFCKQTGNELLAQTEASNEYTFFLKRK